jgi:AcrR family transcriptional regulator
MSVVTTRPAAPTTGGTSPSQGPFDREGDTATPSGRHVRGWRVVDKVLEATLEELASKGYGLLSVEEVAARAGVAKTTIYRRWPAKSDLALDALRRVADDVSIVVDTGSLRGDLIAGLKAFRALATSRRGQSLIRMMVAEGLDAEVTRLVKKIRTAKEIESHAMVMRAVERGELPRGTDPRLLLDVLFGAVQHYLFFMHARCSDEQLGRIVDLVLVGATNGGARTRSPR